VDNLIFALLAGLARPFRLAPPTASAAAEIARSPVSIRRVAVGPAPPCGAPVLLAGDDSAIGMAPPPPLRR